VPGGRSANTMLGKHRVVLDQWSEVYDLLKPYADAEFWRFAELEFDPDAITIIGRVQLKENWYRVCDLADQYPGRIMFCNPAEGSQTLLLQLKRLRIDSLVRSGKILLLTSGDMDVDFDYVKTDGYFSHICEYTENLAAAQHDVRATADKPYDFLFLNGRLRPHRKYLIDSLRDVDLLDRALWTNLGSRVEMEWTSELKVSDQEPIRFLPAYYEIERAVSNLGRGLEQNSRFVKHELFNNTWGDAIINPAAYIDSCFSVVTETIFDYPYTFRTEKIWKPMIMAHPFVIAANVGYYRDLHRAGFRTFGSLINEEFNLISDPKDRMDAMIHVIRDIVTNGAASFLEAATEICKYNQQHLREHNRRERGILPQTLTDFLDARS
jgi:hypothetical protein